ncbi:transglutaminaseTgpA domain-containing protein [Ferrimonas senticii]|uniref:transglutaminase family protein n=1 Tax=Ferrimonas senticii TaxID=394566 RepID=UPI000410B8C2|nr:DUF3488 and transglutaminase-like domain-containing protein [Ferrimonas senticii]
MNSLSRVTQGWLLVAQVALIVPLTDNASPMTMAIVALCLLWRLGIFYARWAKPPRWLLNLLGLASVAALFAQFGSSDTMTSLINLLLLGYSLKAIEARNGADLMVVVLTGYFLIGLQLLDSFGPLMGLQLLLMVILNSACMLSSYRWQSLKQNLWFASKMVLASLPLALMMFVLIPRLPPIWQIQTGAISRTGLSDSMALGDVAALTRSDELVMRASFDGALPPANQLYWRALVLDQYDGRRWTVSASQTQAPIGPAATPPFRGYQLQIEANNQRWLPVLRGSNSADPAMESAPAQRLRWRTPLLARTNVSLTQGQLSSRDDLTAALRRQNLQLPAQGNPDSRQWASQLAQQFPQPQQRMQALMAHFNQRPFRYTLTPPPLGQHQIDDFLFGSQAGFCGHYASAAVFIARASGIPARLVNGYQGGTPSRDGDFVSVYQYNAHAWMEYWLEGKGWQRLDPTAAVDPTRVEQGPEVAFADEPAFVRAGGLFTWRNSDTLRQLRLLVAQLDYQWSQYVVGLNNDRQQQLWQRWLGGFQWWKLAALLAATLLLVGLWQSGLWRAKARLSPAQLSLNRCQRQLAKWQLARAKHEPVERHLQRLQQAEPLLYRHYQPFAEAFIQQQYNPDSQITDEQLAALARRFIKATAGHRVAASSAAVADAAATGHGSVYR